MHQILEIITRVSLKFTVAGTLPFLQAGFRSFLSIIFFNYIQILPMLFSVNAFALIFPI